MAWFKVDDQAHGHPKMRRASLAAIGLWTLAGSYSSAYGLNGAVPATFVDSWPQGRKAAQSLVDADLWEATPDGYFFHDWDDYQPSADEVEKARASARKRQRERRQRLRAECDNEVTNDTQ